MAHWVIVTVVFGAMICAMLGAGWSQLLEHQRRKAALEVIKAAIQAGREPPPAVYAELTGANRKESSFTAVTIFAALSVGFWTAYFTTAGSARTAFLVVAATMTVVFIAMSLQAFFESRRRGGDAG